MPGFEIIEIVGDYDDYVCLTQKIPMVLIPQKIPMVSENSYGFAIRIFLWFSCDVTPRKFTWFLGKWPPKMIFRMDPMVLHSKIRSRVQRNVLKSLQNNRKSI